jgi:hypothetical protein
VGKRNTATKKNLLFQVTNLNFNGVV